MEAGRDPHEEPPVQAGGDEPLADERGGDGAPVEQPSGEEPAAVGLGGEQPSGEEPAAVGPGGEQPSGGDPGDDPGGGQPAGAGPSGDQPSGAGPSGGEPSGPPAPPAGPWEPFRKKLSDRALEIFSWLLTGTGFAAFLGFTGAAATWVRLEAAELPATDVLQRVPAKTFIAEGAVALVTFAVLGLIAVAVVYAIDAYGRPTDGMRRGLIVLAALEIVIAIWVAEEHLGDQLGDGDALGAMALVAGLALLAFTVFRPVGDARRSPDKPVAQRVAEAVGAGPMTTALATPEPLPVPAYGAPATQPGPTPAPAERRRLTTKGVAMVVGAAVVLALVLGLRYRPWVGMSVLVAIGSAAVLYGIANRTGTRFLPYGIAVFFSVSVFGSWLTIARLDDEPKLSPIALLRKGAEGTDGVVGLFVARDDDRFWLAAVTCRRDGKEERVDGGSGRIYSIPRNQVVDEELGDQTTVVAAGRRSLDLLRELVRRQPAGGPPPEPPPATTTTTPATTTTTPASTTTTPAEQTPETAETAAPAPPAPPAPPATPAPTGTSEDLSPDDAAQIPKTLAVTRCDPPPPRLIRLDPAAAPPGAPVQIVGTDLGRAGTVRLRGAPVATGAWNESTVSFQVPKRGARDGRVNVTTGGRTSNSLVLTIKPNGPPVAAIDVHPSGRRGFLLDGSGSSDPEGGPLRYRWRSGGRRIGTRKRIRLRLTGPRSAFVSLTVTDDQGASSTQRKRIEREVIRVTLTEASTFEFGRWELTPEGERRVASLGARIGPRADQIRGFTVSGFADFVGSDAFNEDLSRRRAETVRAALANAAGVEEEAIAVRAYGERRARATTLSDPRRALDRRVDVEVVLES